MAITKGGLLGIEKTVLTVRGLDAVDRTPIIDIKPHTPQYDLQGKSGFQSGSAVWNAGIIAWRTCSKLERLSLVVAGVASVF